MREEQNITEQKSILVVDDEKRHREALTKRLMKDSYEVHAAENGKAALEFLRQNYVNLIITDLKMPKMDGVQLLKAAKTLYPEIEVIMMTGYGTVNTAVEAMQEGAYHYIEKPLKPAEVKTVVARAMEKQILVLENRFLKNQLEKAQYSRYVIGQSDVMRQLLDKVQQIAPSSATVLVMGESGAGKEVIATAVHLESPRRDKPLIKVNCAAFPETLLESELFGYERGAFTGATKRKPGRFELADGGTLFLDEIGDMSVEVQVKLLRVLQEGEFERLGGTTTLKVDIRIIAATTKDLKTEIQEGRFREELFWRLNVIPLTIPPLRERTEDIPLLVNHFIKIYNTRNDKQIRGISRDALEILRNYAWPGNVRELENAIEQAVVLARDDAITIEDLPQHIYADQSKLKSKITVPIGTPLAEIEHKVILETLKQTKGDKELAAKLLGISSRTIYRKLDEKNRRNANFK